MKKTGAKLIFATTTPVPAKEPQRKEGSDQQYNAAALEVMKSNYGPRGEKQKLRWEDGCYVLESSAPSPRQAAAAHKIDDLFVRLLEERNAQGRWVTPNKAVVGANAFAHEAGIHQDGILKNPLTYEILAPETVGVPARRLVLGKHSGRNAFRARLQELGYETTDRELAECYGFAMAQADAEREITDRDLINIIHQVRRGETPRPANPGPATAAAR